MQQEHRSLKEMKGYSAEELETLSHIAYCMMMQGKYDKAQTVYESLLAIDPADEYYYRALGVLAQKQGDSELALRHFGYSIQLAPKQPQGYINRAEIHIALNRIQDALNDLKEALAQMRRQDQMLSQKAWALYKHLQTAQNFETV